MVVMTRYNQRTYTIHDIAWDLTCLSKFTYEGSHITYLEYYQKVRQEKGVRYGNTSKRKVENDWR